MVPLHMVSNRSLGEKLKNRLKRNGLWKEFQFQGLTKRTVSRWENLCTIFLLEAYLCKAVK